MNNQQIIQILEEYQLFFKQVGPTVGLESIERYKRNYTDDQIPDFIFDLTEVGNKNNIIFLQNGIAAKEFEAYLNDLLFPVLFFVREEDRWIPISYYTISRRKKRVLKYYGDRVVEIGDLPPIEDILKDENGDVLMLAAFKFNSLVSPEEVEDEPKKKLTPINRLLRLLGTEKRDISYVYIYGLIIGIISLAMPLGVQGIIGQVAGGVEISTIWILIGLVIIAVLINGGLQVMQMYIVEIMQRRVFAKGSYEFAFRIPRLKIEAIQKDYAPELINRFFDILTVQKGMPKLLMDISTALLQILFGLVLLSFYHSSFVFFGLLLMFVFGLIFYLTGPKGLQTSLETSKYKYKVVYWLEELARALLAFKMAGNTELPVRRADANLNQYLTYRHKHFKVLLTQYILIVLFKTLVIGGLLIIGTFLVINRQITLGQFVASELVVVIIVNAVEKIIMYMDIIYDMLTAVEKIGQVTDLPLEKSGGVNLPDKFINHGLHIKVRNLKYKYDDTEQYALQGIDMDISPGKKVVITGHSGAGKTTLINILSGIFTDYKGTIAYNNIPLQDLNLMNLRNSIARNISLEDLFEGSIIENINLGKTDTDYNDVVMAAEQTSLLEFVQSMPKGFHSQVIGGGKNFPESIAQKIILTRCILKKPKLLLLNDFFLPFDEKDKHHLINLVIKKAPWTLIAVSNDPIVHKACDHVFELENGMVREIK